MFTTTDMKKTKENRVEIQNFTPDLIPKMLKYFYTFKTNASGDAGVALKMIPMADICQIESLKNICEATMLEKININNVLDVLCKADEYNIA